MSAQCAKCSKTVYKAEELKCLDKSWHKQCFKCSECGMTLTLKNHKGYNKMPYCNAHYPQLKGTSVASTPEQDRLRQLSALSENQYKKDFKENMVGATPAMPDNIGVGQPAQNLGRVMTGGSVSDYPEDNQMSAGGGGDVYRALYSYDASDQDEVSIMENDIIVDVEILDEGWATGTVQRTGERGMIPSNYIEAQ